ncbi:MAG TPA: class I SAM-dependent methyltransferase [Polyangiaceae bacterium]
MRRLLIGLSFSLAACASAPPPETPAYHHPFTNAAEWSKTFDDPSRDAWQKPQSVVDAMEIATGATIADIGAGTGYFEPYLSRAAGPGGKVLALDVEPDMVAHLRDRAAKNQLANVEAKQVAADDPGLAPGSVDRILVVDTWHHIANRVDYAARLAVALKHGGEVFIVDFTREAQHGPPPEHRVPREEVARALETAGLVVRDVDAGLPDQYVVAGKRPQSQ